MAYRCFKLALTFNNDHAEAYNNIGVLESKKGKEQQVRDVLAGYYTGGGVEKIAGWKGLIRSGVTRTEKQMGITG